MTQTTSLAAAQARIIELEAQVKAADELYEKSLNAFDWLEMMEGKGNSYTSVRLRAALAAYNATGEQP